MRYIGKYLLKLDLLECKSGESSLWLQLLIYIYPSLCVVQIVLWSMLIYTCWKLVCVTWITRQCLTYGYKSWLKSKGVHGVVPFVNTLVYWYICWFMSDCEEIVQSLANNLLTMIKLHIWMQYVTHMVGASGLLWHPSDHFSLSAHSQDVSDCFWCFCEVHLIISPCLHIFRM